MIIQASLPSGTRDFSPAVVRKRNFITGIIKSVFECYAFQPLETPAMENLATLTGKYGEEGDQLLFKILNSRLHESSKKEQLQEIFEKSLSGAYHHVLLTERALRYDLTIPFARYASMNRNEISLPFKRYQIQPVWRADKPQKGRYREFYQCDADVIGSTSLLNEIELLTIFNLVFKKLGIDVKIKINNRKILQGLCEICNLADQFTAVTVIIDKLDKIGLEKVKVELMKISADEGSVNSFLSMVNFEGDLDAKISMLSKACGDNAMLTKGLEELKEIFAFIKGDNFELDFTLARGLDYYTGCIFEVKGVSSSIGSLGGGGRYDDLTGIFGWKDVSGVGISFGLDRVYDVMEELGLFPADDFVSTQVLILHFAETINHSFGIGEKLRAEGISCMLFPDAKKMQKQMEYAHKNNIPWVVIIGEDEMKTNSIALKEMKSGEQTLGSFEEILLKIKK